MIWKACKNINYCVNPLEFDDLEPYQQAKVLNWYYIEAAEEKAAHDEAERRARFESKANRSVRQNRSRRK